MRRRTGAVGTLFAIAAIVPLADPAHAQDLDCRDFTFQEDAQAVFDADPNDPHRLDEDQGPDDGIACEVLPRRGDGLTSSTSRPMRPATPAVTPTATPTVTPTATPTVTPTATRTATPAHTATPARGVRGGLGGASTSGPSDWDIAIGLAFVTGGALTAGYLVKRRRS
ncbi:hypothetical protein GCM10027074_69220 [Streptomyces deserti]